MERQPEQPEALRASGRIYITSLTGDDEEEWEPPELTFESPPLGDDWVDLGYVDDRDGYSANYIITDETHEWIDAVRNYQEQILRDIRDLADQTQTPRHYVVDVTPQRYVMDDTRWGVIPPTVEEYYNYYHPSEAYLSGERPAAYGRHLNNTMESASQHVYEYDGDLICETCWLRSEAIYSGCNIPKHRKMEPVEWM